MSRTGFLNGALINVELGTQNNLIVSDPNMGANGSVLLVGSGAYNNFTSSVILGSRAALAAADGTTNLVAIGRQCYENLIGGISQANVAIGTGAARFVLTGTNSTVVGSSAVNNATVLSTSVVIGQLAGSGADELTASIILGRSATGPAGIVANYLSLGNTIQGDLSANTINIGGTANTKPTNTELSLSLDSTTQVFKTNEISSATEAGLTNTDAAIYYNSDLDLYRAIEGGVLKTFLTAPVNNSTAAYPPGFISWVNGPIRVSGTNFRLNAALNARDDANSGNVNIGGNKNNAIGVSGVGGINATQFPATADTFYNIRALNDSTGVNAADTELIELGTSPALPAGYDLSVVLYPPIKVDAAGTAFEDHTFTVQGTSVHTSVNLSATAAEILNGGAATVSTLVTTAPILPVGNPILGHFNLTFSNVGGAFTDAATVGGEDQPTDVTYANKLAPGIASAGGFKGNIDAPITATGNIRYNVSAAADALTIRVLGYTTSMRF